jgi:hypothetical protein
MAKRNDIIICSFYSNDDYYRGWANKLRANLEDLGVEYELLEIEKKPGEDWADITRRKVGFLARVCEEHPAKKVFWTDVDCSLLALPDYVANFTADIIGFQRGFGSPLTIGYEKRTRFWEPCFWGINTTPQARKMIRDAYAIEQAATEIKATDDYFMEEAWRENANDLTFQMIPSNAIIDKGQVSPNSHTAFYQFGSSGNVDEFKGKVAQHGSGKGQKITLRRRALRVAKKIESALPESMSNRLRLTSDAIGMTGLLTKARQTGPNKVRDTALQRIVKISQQAGSGAQTEQLASDFEKKFRLTQNEINSIEASRTFAYYANHGFNASPATKESIALAWWPRPFPGNFGDWLSPLIFSAYTNKNITFQQPAGVAATKHLISLGSIGRFIKSNSVVVGTGISTDEIQLNTKAQYISVRGPVTARVLAESGGPKVESFGDPGIIISRVIPVKRGKTNGRIAFVRHFSHKQIPMVLKENMDELDVLMSHPNSITEFVKQLNKYDKVVTSAMHVFITCQSYGIPCGLVTFDGFEENVHGNGIKYGDYAQGAGLDHVDPIAVPLNLTKVDFDNIITDHKVSKAKLDEVEAAVKAGLDAFNR